MGTPGSFESGQVTNPNGRVKGSRNRKKVSPCWFTIEARGDLDPIDYLSSVASNTNLSPEIRCVAANYLLPYKYFKHGSLIAPRYIEEPVDLPRPTSIAEANSNIALISEMKAQGRIDLDFADSLIADNRTIANNLIAEEELKLKLTAQGGHPNQIIHIEGGLPPLPGTNVIMPEMNGAQGQGGELQNGHTIDHIPAADPPAIEAEDQKTNSDPPAIEAEAQKTNSGTPEGQGP